MNTLAPRIGMDRYIDAEWMLLGAAVARGEIPAEVLQTRLVEDIPSAQVRTKTKGILNRIWLPTDNAGQDISVAAANLIAQVPDTAPAAFEAVAIAAYPYFRQVMEHVGRLLRLQDSCSAGEVHRRMFEQHGKRTTIDQATSYAFKTLISWGMLTRAENKRLAPVAELPLSPASLCLLNRAANRSRTTISPLASSDPLLFPFATVSTK